MREGKGSEEEDSRDGKKAELGRIMKGFPPILDFETFVKQNTVPLMMLDSANYLPETTVLEAGWNIDAH